MSEVNPVFLARFVRSVALLALPFEEQAVWLSSLRLGEPGYADELALEFEDGVLLARQFEERGWMSSDALQAIDELDAMLDARSGPSHKEFWALDALRGSPDWSLVRRKALEVLRAI